jgi:hypothetical protein
MHFPKVLNSFKNLGCSFETFQKITITFQFTLTTNKLHLRAQVLIE